MSTATAALPLVAGVWPIDPVHSNVEFTVRHMGISKVRGRFNKFNASLTVGDSLETTQLSASIELASVDTNDEQRDGHLQSADFFTTEANPSMEFASTSITDNGDGEYTLIGDLSLNGVTKPITLAAEFNGAETYPMDQKVHAGFSAKGTLSRKEYGVDFDVPFGVDKVAIGDKVAIELEIQFTQPE